MQPDRLLNDRRREAIAVVVDFLHPPGYRATKAITSPEPAWQRLREWADAKRREFVDVAQSQVATGTTMLSDEIGKKLESIIDRVPGGVNVRPLIESSVQIAQAAALEGLLRKRTRS
jgi:hypothetical protein